MKDRTEQVLRTAKEVALKYIETGRLPLTSFGEAFAAIYQAVERVVPAEPAEEKKAKK
jgi:hypothetical protein